MKTNAANDSTIKHSTTQNELPDSKVLQEAQLLWNELRALLQNRLQLAVLETRRAGESLVIMIIAGVMVAVLLIGAWLGLVLAGVQMLIEHGVVISTAILLAVVANLLIALLLCGVIRRKSHYLQFPALLTSLQAVPKRKHHDPLL
jgi:hypothetical protein